MIAVQDGEVVQVGDSPSLGRFVTLRDAYGNTYVYAGARRRRVGVPGARATRSHRPESARRPAPQRTGAQRTGDGGRAAALAAERGRRDLRAGTRRRRRPGSRPAPTAALTPPTQVPSPRKPTANVRVFSEGANEVYLHPLVPGVQVIAGTVLGHVGASSASGGQAGAPVKPPRTSSSRCVPPAAARR